MSDDEHDNEIDLKALRREMNVAIKGVHDHIRTVAEESTGRDEAIVRRLEEMNTVNREEHETFRKALTNHVSRSEMQVAIESVHDHIRMVAEGASGQNEAVVRRLDEMQRSFNEMQRDFGEMQRSFDELREDNLSQHKTLLNVLGDHEERISALEQRSE